MRDFEGRAQYYELKCGELETTLATAYADASEEMKSLHTELDETHGRMAVIEAALAAAQVKINHIGDMFNVRGHKIADLEAALAAAEVDPNRRFPLMRTRSLPEVNQRTWCPWWIAELAYIAYGSHQTLERVAERGGFGNGEMDRFCPDWRERMDLTLTNATVLAAAEAKLVEAFCQGARWWEFHSTGGTMWQSDQELAFQKATERQIAGTLGIRPEERAARIEAKADE